MRIALLRGINVGGNKKLTMLELRHLAEQLGLTKVQTVLQTGNLIFQNPLNIADEALEDHLEKNVVIHLNTEVSVIIRSIDDWRSIINNNPFIDMANQNPQHLVVVFLKTYPNKNTINTLQNAILGQEKIDAHNKNLYIVYPNGIGRSKLTHALIEKILGVKATARNWNTLLKINELL
jgi:uncharacterized protein (DUF1697 family)